MQLENDSSRIVGVIKYARDRNAVNKTVLDSEDMDISTMNDSRMSVEMDVSRHSMESLESINSQETSGLHNKSMFPEAGELSLSINMSVTGVSVGESRDTSMVVNVAVIVGGGEDAPASSSEYADMSVVVEKSFVAAEQSVMDMSVDGSPQKAPVVLPVEAATPECRWDSFIQYIFLFENITNCGT